MKEEESEKHNLPKPLTKADPIRWDFSQQKIEKMMNIIQEAIDYSTEPHIYQQLWKIKDDWQRKINWNRERGYWK